MTRQCQKDRERFFAQEAARSLGAVWSFDESSERPDFIVSESGHRFGLEVTEVFLGPHTRGGSSMKAREARTQKDVNAMRREYETAAEIPLHVRFIGIMDAENMEKVLPVLLANDLPSKPLGHKTVIDTGGGLRVYVTKALRPEWYSGNDRVGFVDRDAPAIIKAAIARKAQDLAIYKKAAAAEVRLLLFADRIHNSGKLTADGVEGIFNLHGFSAVYFFPYPESAISLPHVG